MKFRYCFKVVHENILVMHSSKDANETSCQTVLNGTLEIGHSQLPIYRVSWDFCNSSEGIFLIFQGLQLS